LPCTLVVADSQWESRVPTGRGSFIWRLLTRAKKAFGLFKRAAVGGGCGSPATAGPDGSIHAGQPLSIEVIQISVSV